MRADVPVAHERDARILGLEFLGRRFRTTAREVFEPQRQQVKPMVQPKQEAPKPEAPSINVDAFIEQVKEELSHCTTREEAKQVWRRYTPEIGQIKIHFADRENDVMSAFSNSTKHLK